MSLACKQRDRITHDMVGLPGTQTDREVPQPQPQPQHQPHPCSPIPVAPASCSPSPMQPQPHAASALAPAAWPAQEDIHQGESSLQM